MKRLSRRALLRGRLFGHAPAADDPPLQPEPEPQPEPQQTQHPLPQPDAPHARAAPPPPWERALDDTPSPVAQVAPWELGPIDPSRSEAAPNARATRLNNPRLNPGRPMTFSIQTNLCLAWRNMACSVCRERCPETGAITVQAGRPTIDPEQCTGCGDCVAVCPAPIMAIRMLAPSKKRGLTDEA